MHSGALIDAGWRRPVEENSLSSHLHTQTLCTATLTAAASAPHNFKAVMNYRWPSLPPLSSAGDGGILKVISLWQSFFLAWCGGLGGWREGGGVDWFQSHTKKMGEEMDAGYNNNKILLVNQHICESFKWQKRGWKNASIFYCLFFGKI